VLIDLWIKYFWRFELTLCFTQTQARLGQNFAVLVHLCMYLPDDGLIEVETGRRDVLNYK